MECFSLAHNPTPRYTKKVRPRRLSILRKSQGKEYMDDEALLKTKETIVGYLKYCRRLW